MIVVAASSNDHMGGGLGYDFAVRFCHVHFIANRIGLFLANTTDRHHFNLGLLVLE